eukprot:1905753-Karenia_brevis.AAC.1
MVVTGKPHAHMQSPSSHDPVRTHHQQLYCDAVSLQILHAQISTPTCVDVHGCQATCPPDTVERLETVERSGG